MTAKLRAALDRILVRLGVRVETVRVGDEDAPAPVVEGVIFCFTQGATEWWLLPRPTVGSVDAAHEWLCDGATCEMLEE